MRHPWPAGILLLCMLLAVPAHRPTSTASSHDWLRTDPLAGRPHATAFRPRHIQRCLCRHLAQPPAAGPGPARRGGTRAAGPAPGRIRPASALFQRKHRDAASTSGGRQRAQRHAAVLQSLEERFRRAARRGAGRMGRDIGLRRMPRSRTTPSTVLGTKAFMARRRDMFRAEILAALVMLGARLCHGGGR